MTSRPEDLEDLVKSLDSSSLRQRLSLFLRVLVIVVTLSLVKATIHWLELEFLTLNPLFTSAIGGAIFIIGFLLASILADYKESERMPSEMRVALEAIHDDMSSFAATHAPFDLRGLRLTLANTVRAFTRGLSDPADHGDLRPTLRHIDKLSSFIASAEQAGIPANYVVRLRASQDQIRRSVLRTYHIQKTQFVPSIHILVYSLVASIIFLMLFLKTEGSPESALLFGFVAYMFIYALHLIQLLEKPFRKGEDTLDDVSLFLLRDFDDKVCATLAETPLATAARHEP